MADFTHSIKAQAVIDGTVINLSAARVMTGILHYSRGVLSSSDVEPMDGSHDFIFMCQREADAVLELTNGATDVMDLSMVKGHTFTIPGPSSFDRTASAGDTTVPDDEVSVQATDPGFGARIEFITLSTQAS
jgi:hypothetical protein